MDLIDDVELHNEPDEHGLATHESL